MPPEEGEWKVNTKLLKKRTGGSGQIADDFYISRLCWEEHEILASLVLNSSIMSGIGMIHVSIHRVYSPCSIEIRWIHPLSPAKFPSSALPSEVVREVV